MSNSPEPKHSKPLATISLIIALVALAAFFILNRKMAPPFPKTQPGQAATNSASNTNDSK
jgi:hypothetical protein